LWTLRAHVASPRRAGGSGWASLHVPIVVHGQRVGALAALRQRGEPFGRDERRAVSRLAHLIALAWTTEHYQRLRADEARVAERRRIGEDLHDNASQLLFAARVSVEALRESPVLPGDLASQLERTHELIARADAAVREVINAPEPAKPAGLGERLGEIVSAVEDEFRRPVQLVVSAPAAEAARTLSAHAHNLLGKVVREALVNAAKHAGPCQIAVSVSLTRRRRLLLSVSDDGIGTPSGRHADGFGLTATRRAVRRQGGVLRVHCGATGGTRVAVSLPL
jgi:signal transduction histidine kinase